MWWDTKLSRITATHWLEYSFLTIIRLKMGVHALLSKMGEVGVYCDVWNTSNIVRRLNERKMAGHVDWVVMKQSLLESSQIAEDVMQWYDVWTCGVLLN
jgi:hypothetical protein